LIRDIRARPCESFGPELCPFNRFADCQPPVPSCLKISRSAITDCVRGRTLIFVCKTKTAVAMVPPGLCAIDAVTRHLPPPHKGFVIRFDEMRFANIFEKTVLLFAPATMAVEPPSRRQVHDKKFHRLVLMLKGKASLTHIRQNVATKKVGC
jgi:hypothetical protein